MAAWGIGIVVGRVPDDDGKIFEKWEKKTYLLFELFGWSLKKDATESLALLILHGNTQTDQIRLRDSNQFKEFLGSASYE